jgi:hypothetical protein
VLLRSVALTMALVFAAIPAAALACQLACAAPAGSMLHHASHGAPDAAAVRAAHPSCDHTGTIEPARTASGLRLAALVATLVPYTIAAPAVETHAAIVDYTAHSPPGGRSAPLSLRI